MGALLAGFGLGFAVAAGFGPINVFCLSSGLRYGFWPAFGVGLGAAVVDAFYALIAGIGAAALFTGSARGWLEVVGGVALIVVAWRMGAVGRNRPSPAGGAAALAGGGRPARFAVSRFSGTFVLSVGATLANPLTILSWAAVFAGVVSRLDPTRVATLVLLLAGVGAGTLTWFTIVSAGSAYAGRYVTERLLRWVSTVAAIVIAGFGVWFVVAGARTLT